MPRGSVSIKVPGTEERATLLVDPAAGDGAVQAVYEAWGYRKVGEQQPFPDSPVFASMARACPDTSID